MKLKTNKTSTKKNHKQKLEIKRIRTEVETQTTKRTKSWRREKKKKKIALPTINHPATFYICTINRKMTR
jgi:hypothetical protein